MTVRDKHICSKLLARNIWLWETSRCIKMFKFILYHYADSYESTLNNSWFSAFMFSENTIYSNINKIQYYVYIKNICYILAGIYVNEGKKINIYILHVVGLKFLIHESLYTIWRQLSHWIICLYWNITLKYVYKINRSNESIIYVKKNVFCVNYTYK